jgi:hypothetical protein
VAFRGTSFVVNPPGVDKLRSGRFDKLGAGRSVRKTSGTIFRTQSISTRRGGRPAIRNRLEQAGTLISTDRC